MFLGLPKNKVGKGIKARVSLNTTESFSLLHLQCFLVCLKTKSVRVSNQFIFDTVGVDEIFYCIREKSVVGNFLNLKLNTTLPAKRYEN